MLQRLFMVLLCAFGCGLTIASSATAQDLFFNTDIVSFDLTGTATLPLGENGSLIDTTISLTKAQDHNSTRSNKTASIAAPPEPDDVNPDDLDGKMFPLYSTIDMRFSMSFSDVDPDADFSPSLGIAPVATTPSAANLELVGTLPGFVFDASAPDFGMLLLGDTPSGVDRFRFRGHVTVLKAAFGGGGGDIDFDADGMQIIITPGSDAYKTLPGGVVEHAFGVTMTLSGTYLPGTPEAQPFVTDRLTGVVVERGRLLNNVVPEPSSVLLAMGGLALVVGACRRRG